MRIQPRIILIYLCFCFLLAGCKTIQLTNQDQALDSSKSEEITEAKEESKKDDNQRIIQNNSSSQDGFDRPNSSLQRNVSSFLSKSEIFSEHFTGFSLLDVRTKQILVNVDAEKYFIPASNVKTFTLYTVLKSFDELLPGILYVDTPDTLYLKPIGDPSFLHPEFSKQPIRDLIATTSKTIVVEWPDDQLNPFGNGWMWDDYGSGYMPEVSWMPVYGNIVQFNYDRPNVQATPALFNDLVEIQRTYNGRSNTISRAPQYNFFKAEIRYPNWSFEKNVPFRYSKSLALNLIKEATGKVLLSGESRTRKYDTLYSQPVDTVLRRMMQESDNFLAEQLLIMAALKNGFTNTDDFRDHVVETWFQDIEPKWVDGSGLSRYNLIRPIDNVRLLNRLYEEFGWARIHNLFAQGGISGTIKDWYPNRADPENPNLPIQPYIIAKTGTLSNNHCLSGYMQTNSGRLLAFSFMNNNFVRPTSEVKEEMQKLLETIRDYY